jgi:hypothetical protein
MAGKHLTKRQQYLNLKTQLDNEFSSFRDHYQVINDYLLPTRLRLFASDVNKGHRRNSKIIDCEATLALDTLSAGLMSGITSPARPWFKVTTEDEDLAEFARVKQWLHKVTNRMLGIFSRSNFYNEMPNVYSDTGGFGTGALLGQEDFETTVHWASIPVGSYRFAKDSKGRVNVFAREIRMTVRQVVDTFGDKNASPAERWANISDFVKEEYNNANYETWVDVLHTITPNSEYDRSRLQAKFKKFRSCYAELGRSANTSTYAGDYMDGQDIFLRESGYDYFPVLGPRWKVNGEDVYATSCPGMTVLGDIKQLQTMQRRKHEAVEHMVRPSMVGPTILKKTGATSLPGGVTHLNETADKKYRPAFETNLRVDHLRVDIDAIKDIIQRGFHVPLMIAAINDERAKTAAEVYEIKEEKYLQMGPVLQRFNEDCLKPAIDMVFNFALMQQDNQIPEPPPELQGRPLKIEFVSIMAEAQKLAGAAGLERFTNFYLSMYERTKDPRVLRKVNGDQILDVYGQMMSTAHGIVRSDDEVAELDAQAAQAEEAAATAELARNAAGAARDLGNTPMGGDNLLQRLSDAASAGALEPGVA